MIRHRGQQGMTLVELMVAMAVLAILAGVATMSWRAMAGNIRLKSEAQQLLATLQWSKAEATRRNACVAIIFNGVAFPDTGGTYTVFLDDGGVGGGRCDRTIDPGETILRTVNVDREVSLLNPNFGFGAKGMCFTSSGTTCGSMQNGVRLRNQNLFYQAAIRAAGGVMMQRSTDGKNWL